MCNSTLPGVGGACRARILRTLQALGWGAGDPFAGKPLKSFQPTNARWMRRAVPALTEAEEYSYALWIKLDRLAHK